MRLAQRQIRPVVANRSHGFRQTDARQRCGESKKGDERSAANGETRHQPPEAGIRARITPRKRQERETPRTVNAEAQRDSSLAFASDEAAVLDSGRDVRYAHGRRRRGPSPPSAPPRAGSMTRCARANRKESPVWRTARLALP